MMEYRGYVAKVECDDGAGVFHGEVLNLRDVITFEGKTVAELRKAFRDSVDDYLEFCAERKEVPRKNQWVRGGANEAVAPGSGEACGR